MTLSEVVSVNGKEGDFTVAVTKHPRYVDPDKCIACGLCAEKCPKKVPDRYNAGLGQRKAIYIPFPQAVPKYPVIDADNCIYFQRGKCKACQIFCPTQPNAIAGGEKGLFDTVTGKLLTGKRYKGWTTDQRRIMLRFAGECGDQW